LETSPPCDGDRLMASMVEIIFGSEGETKKTSGIMRMDASRLLLPYDCTKACLSSLQPFVMMSS
jgi:hypothetical protein